MKRRKYFQVDRGGTFTDTGARRALGRLPAPGLLPDDLAGCRDAAGSGRPDVAATRGFRDTLRIGFPQMPRSGGTSRQTKLVPRGETLLHGLLGVLGTARGPGPGADRS